MGAPPIHSSTYEERLAYVRRRFSCISDCDQCGLCVLFRHMDPETALEEYLQGREELPRVLMRYRTRR